MKFNSITLKISILYTTILGIILIIYSSGIYISLHYVLYKELDLELLKKAHAIENTIKSYVEALNNEPGSIVIALKKTVRLERFYSDRSKIDELDKNWLILADKLNLKLDFINIRDVDKKISITSTNLNKGFHILLLEEVNDLHLKKKPFKNIKYNKKGFRIVSLLSKYGDKNYIIQVVTSLKPVISLLDKELIFIIVSIPIILFVSFFAGKLFSSSFLKSVNSITETAKKITHEDLSSRVESSNVDIEMQPLVFAFNEMIERLENSFKYVSEFSSHVAHELKTPLAIIRGECEVALRKERDIEEYKRVLYVNLEEFARMLKTIDDLLLLTKLDYHPHVFSLEVFDLYTFLEEVFEQAKLLAANNNLNITSDFIKTSKIMINGNKLHLRRLFFNIIQNAVKFNKPKGNINMSFHHDELNAFISIKDSGIGIKSENISKIFNKFFHLQPSDNEEESGNGLGLSIAKSIAYMHGGDICVESEVSVGSIFTVRLPVIKKSISQSTF